LPEECAACRSDDFAVRTQRAYVALETDTLRLTIPNPASMCYDAGANQLVIPMNPNNGLAFVPLK
jgi:hypothetical protein